MSHETIERKVGLMGALIAVVISVGGLVEIVPLYAQRSIVEPSPGVKPYSALALEGRDVYVREGCYNCHSQMIRTLVGDVLRYGTYSKLGESIYDYPHQWGSKRTGPDLAREGGKYPHSWHYFHMRDPRQISPGSTMPNYPWLFKDATDIAALPKKIEVQKILGVPFRETTKSEIEQSVRAQSAAIVADLKNAGAEVPPDREIVALIAYLQKLGKSENVAPATAITTTAAK